MTKAEERQIEPGEYWAYRARIVDPLHEVEVVRFGTKKPQRVLVRFVAPDQESREDWLPPARLKVPWADRHAFTEREQRWEAVRAAAYLRDTPTDYAISTVFAYLPEDWVFATEYFNNDTGILGITDAPGLAAETDLALANNGHPLAFMDGDELIVPWPVSEQIVQRLAVRYTDAILAALADEERETEREKRWGSLTHDGTYISAEIYSEFDVKRQRAREIVRGWCGYEAAERIDELVALRAEVLRLGLLVEAAVAALQGCGADKTAERIERDLGVPVEVVRARAKQVG